ncbi:MAG: PD40 domain-containing protein [Bacteroidaceae bacterium]|nr:PD40 domain-containing protein [Bacteroidaceae bacterium]
MKKLLLYSTLYTLFSVVLACQRTASVPASYAEATDSLAIWPDYTDVTLPPNIAPCNFRVVDDVADEFVATLGDMVVAATDDGVVQWDSVAWRQTLAANRGKSLAMHIFSHRPTGWVRHETTITVADEDIDRYLSYRLIEPGYELYRQLGLYQRDLTNFDEEPIVENNREFEGEHNHCLNCHNYQSYDTRRFLFHIRGMHGGTMIVRDGVPTKVAIKHDSILGTGVYPTWHPTEDLIVFSTNQTGQTFHQYHRERIEVLDKKSDLLFYDIERNEVKHILRTDSALETFPCWTPKGDRLFYCEAKMPPMPAEMPDSMLTPWMVAHWDSLLYDVKSLAFDLRTRSFGAPRTEVSLAKDGFSASVPRVSPDGRYVLFTRGRYGQFHIWHLDADLWVKDLETDSCYALTATNSPDADSYHTWSSNSRWIVLASRRDDGNFSRAFIAYFDKNGVGHKAFMLPQEHPDHNTYRMRSYNVPELTRTAVPTTHQQLRNAVYDQEARVATYKE